MNSFNGKERVYLSKPIAIEVVFVVYAGMHHEMGTVEEVFESRKDAEFYIEECKRGKKGFIFEYYEVHERQVNTSQQ